MAILQKSSAEIVLVEEGEYVGELTNVVDVQGKFGPCIRFVFTILGTENEGATAAILCPVKWVAGNKLDQILTGLGIPSCEVGDQLDSQALLGRRARVYVEHKADAGGTKYNNVTKVKSYKAVVGQPDAQAPAAPRAAAPQPTQAPQRVVIQGTPQTPLVKTKSGLVNGTGVKEVPVNPQGNAVGVREVEEIDFNS